MKTPVVDLWAKEKAAFARGEKIEYRIRSYPHANNTSWVIISDPSWLDSPWDEYRIAPEPEYVPLCAEDVPPGSYFRHESAHYAAWAAPSEITLHGVIFWSQKANPKDGGEHLFISWPELQRYEILRPRGTWQACKKEVAK